MANTTPRYPSLSNVTHDLTFFLKLQQNATLTLADLQTIAVGRWGYFQLNWDFIKSTYLDRITSMQDGQAKVAAQAAYVAFDTLVFDNRTSLINPLSNPATFRNLYDLFDQIYISDLTPSTAENTVITNETRRITNLNKNDFYAMRERVRITHDNLADSLGLGDPTYNQMYGRNGNPQILNFQFPNFAALSALMDMKDQITNLIPTTIVETVTPDPFLLIRNALNNPLIPMTSFQTGFIIPFPHGGSLERLAAQYLGTPDAWLEIAVANGLQFPYIDEVGNSVPLIINGVGNAIIVPLAQYAYLAINDEIFIGSNGVPQTKRLILSLEQDVPNQQLLITVNGDYNMSQYLTTQGAYLFYYTRNTVNSSTFILIPTKGTPDFQINAQQPWFVQSLPQDLKGMGVDLALSPENDLLFNTTGDLMLAYGITNAAQAINLKLNIKVRELLRNPNFGFMEIVGRYNNSEITQNLLLLIVESALAGDDRFGSVTGLGFAISYNTIFINATVQVAGSTQTIPLTFQIPKGT